MNLRELKQAKDLAVLVYAEALARAREQGRTWVELAHEAGEAHPATILRLVRRHRARLGEPVGCESHWKAGDRCDGHRPDCKGLMYRV